MRKLGWVTLLAVAVLSGCGDGGSGTPATPRPAPPPPAPPPEPEPEPVPTCTVGLVLRPGESCRHPSTGAPLTINDDGSASYLLVRSSSRIGLGSGADSLIAVRQEDGSWLVEQVGEDSLNRAPQPVGEIGEQTLTLGSEPATRDLAPSFSDPDGDALTYRAASSDTAVVQASVSGSVLTLTQVAVGTATVTNTATDPGGLSTTQIFGVTVEAAFADSGICRNSVATPSGSSEELVRDCGILVEARATLRGTGFRHFSTNTLNWSKDRPIRAWYGVEATPDGVIEIDVWNANLHGTIPRTLGNLTNLEVLTLKFNSLTGRIPHSLGNLANLRVLNLRDNDLTGRIPDSLGNLRNLEELKLFDNDLTGRIPDSLGNLRNLLEMYLWDNDLSGVIPDSLGNLRNLVELALGQNNLTGRIPHSLGNLTNLQHLGLYLNGLSGAIPDSLRNLRNLQELRLYNNNLTGSIPRWLGNLANLRELNLSRNGLTGAIPVELAQLTSLRLLYLQSNQLTGSIPAELGNLTSIFHLWLNSNQLSGCVPTVLAEFLGNVQRQRNDVRLELCSASSGESVAMSAGAGIRLGLYARPPGPTIGRQPLAGSSS